MSMIYTTIIVGIGQTLLMASHAEYAGIWPHAGGQQFYTQRVAPARYMRFLSYVAGWCILISEVSTSSSSAVNSAEIMSAFIEYQYPDVAWKASLVVLSSMVLDADLFPALDDFSHLHRVLVGPSRDQSHSKHPSAPVTMGRCFQHDWIRRMDGSLSRHGPS